MIKKILRRALLDFYGLTARPAKGVYFLYGHYLSEHNNVSTVKFYNLIEKLSRKVHFLHFEEAVQLVLSNKAKQYKDTFVCFSFDDGLSECCNQMCDILKTFSTNACLFVNPNFIDGDVQYKQKFMDERIFIQKQPADWVKLKSLIKRGFIVGSHTMDHMNLNKISPDEYFYQIATSKEIIEKNLSIECKYFAWPYGLKKDISKEALNLATSIYPFVFGAFRSKNYLSLRDRVINRDHFEGDWKLSHVLYFLSKQKNYESVSVTNDT